MTELVFTFSSVLVFITVYRQKVTAGGLLTGLTLLIRGSFLFLPRRGWLRFIAFMLCILSVWWVRNLIEMHAFIPFSTGSGLVLLGANNNIMYATDANGILDGTWVDPPFLQKWDSFRNLPESATTQAAIAYVRTQPIGFLIQVVIVRIENFWGRQDRASGTTIVFFLSVAISLIRLRILRRNRTLDWRALLLCSAVILGTLLNGIAFWAGMHFRMPAEPFMAMMAGILLTVEHKRKAHWAIWIH